MTLTTLMTVAGFLCLAVFAVFQLVLAGFLLLHSRRLADQEDMEKRLVQFSGSLATLRKDLIGLTESFESYVGRTAVRTSRKKKAEQQEEPDEEQLPGNIWFPSATTKEAS